MKCIKNNKTGEISRVTDEVAMYQVEKRMDYSYVTKSEWKVQIRPDGFVKEKQPIVNSEGKPRRNREKKNRK
jgi:hypothetical protein